jgi:hypothetical protein
MRTGRCFQEHFVHRSNFMSRILFATRCLWGSGHQAVNCTFCTKKGIDKYRMSSGHYTTKIKYWRVSLTHLAHSSSQSCPVWSVKYRCRESNANVRQRHRYRCREGMWVCVTGKCIGVEKVLSVHHRHRYRCREGMWVCVTGTGIDVEKVCQCESQAQILV